MVRVDGASIQIESPTPTQSSRLSLARGIAVARLCTAGWTIAALVLGRRDITHAVMAIAAGAIAIAFTVMTMVMAAQGLPQTAGRVWICIDVAVGVLLMFADGWAFRSGHVFGRGQSITASWPLIAALSCGFMRGIPAGAGAGCALAMGRILGGFANARWHNHGIDWADIGAGAALYTAAGSIGGWVSVLLGRTEAALAISQAEQAHLSARHEVARTLHDTVLQTLAVVARRSEPEIASLAQRTDSELRAYLFDAPTSQLDLASRLRLVAREVGDRFNRPINVSIVGTLASAPLARADAFVGAAREATTNACKHAGANTITIFAETNEHELFVSVRDDGCGFDPATAVRSIGISESILARIKAVGGTVSIDSQPESGTDVQISFP